jgi:hypothetical protein
VDERIRRIGLNEALFREVNERIQDVNEEFGTAADGISILCECGEAGCLERIEVELDDYRRLRADPALFAVLPGHETEATEQVVERHGAYVVVRKHAGGPADFAAELQRDS